VRFKFFVTVCPNSFSAGKREPKLTATQRRELKRFAQVGERQIRRWQNAVDAGESLVRQPGSGRPSIITDGITIALRRIAEATAWTGSNEFYAIALANEGFPVSTSTVQRHLVREGWKTGKASTVPALKPHECANRVVFANEMLQLDPAIVVLHADEKVFYATDSANQRAPPDVKLTKPKKTNAYKTKIMVLAVTGMPAIKYAFDGRLLLHVVGELRAAARNSVHHDKGDVYLSSTGANVDAAYIFTLFASTVGPVIRSRFADAPRVILQMDNASPHVGKGNFRALEETLNEEDEKPYIEIKFQPPNSPDLNLNDLGVFHALAQMTKVIRTRAKMKAAKRNVPSEPLENAIGTRGARRAIRSATSLLAQPVVALARAQPDVMTSSPAGVAEDTIGCRAHHNDESDADMPCIACGRAGNEPAENGDGSWVRCDANGGWWHRYCVQTWHKKAPLPKSDNSSFVCALCRMGSNIVLTNVEDDVDERAAWSSVFDVDVPVRYGLDSPEALWRSVNIAWEALEAFTLTKLSNTLQKVYKCIIQHEGRNDYDVRRSLQQAHAVENE
jgi:transposase